MFSNIEKYANTSAAALAIALDEAAKRGLLIRRLSRIDRFWQRVHLGGKCVRMGESIVRAIVFPGQGSQVVGMGQDFAEHHER